MMNVLRNNSMLFHEKFDDTRIAEYIHEYCAKEAAEVIRQANLILDNTFVFMDRWDMEPCPEPYSISLDDWVTTPNGDPEWVFMLNRHDFLNKLQQAYVLTGDKRYLFKLRAYVLDWIAKNPITLEGTAATRTIDTGIRCMNWVDILVRLLREQIFSDEDASVMIDSLRAQITNMRQRYIGKYTLSNWGVLQTTAICAASIWFPETVPADICRWAWEELREQLSLQILEDGSHWEQSAMYHVEVLNCCTRLLVLLRYAQEIDICLPEDAQRAACINTGWDTENEMTAGPGEGFDSRADGWLVAAIRVMSRHVLYTADPSFMQLAQCDSDVTDVRDVMARAAAWLPNSEIYRFAAGSHMDFDSVWISGAIGLDAFLQTEAKVPEITTWNCATGGNIFVRNKWTEDADFTWMKCSALGSSHGHADQTHLCIYRQGRPFLVDSGRYTYREEDPLRVEFKKSSAHNVCVIDGQSGGEPDGSWSYHSYDDVLKNYYHETDDVHYGEMAFHGCLHDGTTYLIKRKVMMVDDGIWLSVQDVVCHGDHEVVEYFHLDDAVEIQPEKERILLKNDQVQLAVYSQEALQMSTGEISKRYNEKVTAPVLAKKVKMKDRLTSQVLFADAAYKVNPVPVYQLRRSEPLPAQVACAWKIEKPDGTTYTLIMVNREIFRGDKLCSCEGDYFYGKAVVMRRSEGEYRMIRLKT